MSGGKAKRRKEKDHVRLISSALCPNCGMPGAHFMTPVFRQPGAYFCALLNTARDGIIHPTTNQ